jgi:preprotein translocase subunit SecE
MGSWIYVLAGWITIAKDLNSWKKRLRLPHKIRYVIIGLPMRRVFRYFSDVRSELALVVWPSPKSVIKLTLTVILISALIGAYVGGLDAGFLKLLDLVLNKK